MKIQTVCGAILPENVGITLTHEHLSLDFNKFFVEAPHTVEPYLGHEITLENVGYVRQYPYASKDNIKFNDEKTLKAVSKDVALFKKSGGATIVENTSHGLGRNLKLLYDVSKETGVNIIAGTGHYVDKVQSNATLGMTVEQLNDMYTKEILEGVKVDGLDEGQTHIKCGFIGEVGSSWPITPFEKNCIIAAAQVQQAHGCGVSFHPGRDPEAPFEIVRIYLEAGGHAEKCVMSHLDRTIIDDEQLFGFAKYKTYCQFDLFGNECSYYQLNPNSFMPNDEQRIQKVLKLIKNGYENKILLSHDIHTKHRLTSFGGHGYSHIIDNILMRLSAKGVDLKTIDEITTKNPEHWLKMII